MTIPPGFTKLNRRSTPPVCSGVYIIYRGKKLIYVGRAKSLRSRLNCHLVCRLQGFSTYIYETSNGVEIESDLIDEHNPPLNRAGGNGYLYKYGGLKTLRKMAMDETLSLGRIGRHFHVQDQTILNWLNKYKVNRRYANGKDVYNGPPRIFPGEEEAQCRDPRTT